MAQTLEYRYRTRIQDIQAVFDANPHLRRDTTGLHRYLRIVPNEWQALTQKTATERLVLVENLSRQRLERLKSNGAPALTLDTTKRLRNGRFLSFDPDASLSDGAAMVVTGGFYTFDNVPPSILWLDYVIEPMPPQLWKPFSAYLLSWIPSELIALANRGVEVNAEECLRWES